MDAQIVKTLFEDGTLVDLYKAGYVSDSIFIHWNIYNWVSAQVTTRSISKNKAMVEAEVEFDVSYSTVKRALKKFK